MNPCDLCGVSMSVTNTSKLFGICCKVCSNKLLSNPVYRSKFTPSYMYNSYDNPTPALRSRKCSIPPSLEN